MADNVGYTPGTGATVAADEISGVLYQRTKPVVGEDGVAVDVSQSNPMPIDAGNQSTLSMLLVRIGNMLMSPLGYSKDLQRYRQTAVIESGTVTTVSTVSTVTTVTTVTTVSGVTNLNGLAADRLVLNQNFSAWAATHRSRIT